MLGKHGIRSLCLPKSRAIMPNQAWKKYIVSQWLAKLKFSLQLSVKLVSQTHEHFVVHMNLFKKICIFFSTLCECFLFQLCEQALSALGMEPCGGAKVACNTGHLTQKILTPKPYINK
jgi:hypothetical protein